MNKETTKLLEQHFDTAFDTPDGIKKLRELILTLAMQGKLVPQDPNDQPASELLKEIAAEKARLIKAGKLKPQKPLLPINPEEIPYQLPANWQWVRFGDIALIERGGSPRPIKAYLTDDPNGLNWIKIGDTDQGGKYITSTNEKIRQEGLAKTRMVYPGDFLLTNSMSFGRPYITKIAGCIHDGWLRISPPDSLEKDFLYHLLSSSFVRKMFELAAAGAVVLNLNSEKVRELPIPLPTIAEQKRIVARIEQLMARCDELERLRAERDRMRLDTHAAAINQLLSASDGENFSSAWRFITSNFAELYSVKENVAELRKTILQLAVMGKLVPQNPNDQPASELLKEIAAEKARLIKAGKLKPQKPLPPIKPEEIPFKVPSGWQIARFGSVTTEIATGPFGSMIHKSDYIKNGIPLINPSHMINGEIVHDADVTVKDEKALELNSYRLHTGDIVMARRGEMGRCAVVKANANNWLCGTGSFVLRFINSINRQFIVQLLNSEKVRAYLGGNSVGTTMTNLNHGIVNNMVIFLPPLAEQKRIVARVDQLMALCDNLEQNITAAADSRTALLNALMANV